MHKHYAFNVKMVAAFATALLLAACGESGDKAESGSMIDAAALVAPTETGEHSEGTWGDIVYGDPNAPVTITEYASLTCPHCGDMAREYLPDLKKDLVETGKAKLVFRNYIMNRVDITASAAARCGNEETTKKLMEVFYARQMDWARSKTPIDELASLARRVGISRTQFDRCVSNEEMLKHLMQITQDSINKFEVKSVPTFFVNGKHIEFSTYEEAVKGIREAVEAAE